MTALYIILGVLFLIFLPLLFVIFQPLIDMYDKTVKFLYKDSYYDPYKMKAGESIENYNKRLSGIHCPSYISSKRPTFTLKSFCITFITVLLLLILFFINLFFSMGSYI